MAPIKLHEFIAQNRDELIGRCRAKVARRPSPPPTEAEVTYGVPLFLDQLVVELRNGTSKTSEIHTDAGPHGRELLARGFSLEQVVHDYGGDICQSVTDLSVEVSAPISSADFRTLNRCLDDAIAGAVTEFSRGEDVTRDGQSDEMRHLLNTAIAAFEVLQTGSVGIAGTTGALVYRSLLSMRTLMEAAARLRADAAANPDERPAGAGSPTEPPDVADRRLYVVGPNHPANDGQHEGHLDSDDIVFTHRRRRPGMARKRACGYETLQSSITPGVEASE